MHYLPIWAVALTDSLRAILDGPPPPSDFADPPNELLISTMSYSTSSNETAAAQQQSPTFALSQVRDAELAIDAVNFALDNDLMQYVFCRLSPQGSSHRYSSVFAHVLAWITLPR